MGRCKGTNCGAIDGTGHSPECNAEHEAANPAPMTPLCAEAQRLLYNGQAEVRIRPIDAPDGVSYFMLYIAGYFVVRRTTYTQCAEILLSLINAQVEAPDAVS